MKPVGVSQEAWDAAETHRQLWARGPCTIKEAVARAITAAVAAEREAVADWADATADHYDASAIIDAISDVAPNRAAEKALRGFAEAIRARSTP
jgi:hypothetical protein